MTHLLIFAVVGGMASFYVSARADSDARAAAAQDALFAADRAAQDLTDGVAAIQGAVNRTAANPTISRLYGNPGLCNLTYSASGPLAVGHYDLLRSDGSLLCTSQTGPVTGSGYTGSDWLAAALSGPILRAPVIDFGTGAVSVLVTAPIPGYGLMLAFAELAPLGPSLASKFSGPRHLEFLVTTADKATILSRSLNPSRWVGVALKGTPFGHDPQAVQHPDVDGTVRFYGEATATGTGWDVFAGADEGGALAGAHNLALSQLAIILAGLAAILAMTLLLYRRVTQPIRQLSAAARSRAAGGDPAPLTVRGPTEVVGLSEDFNGLLAEVERELAERTRGDSEIQDLNEQLQERIKDRTAQVRELRRVSKERTELSQRLRQLLRRQTSAVEDERRKIAGEIHDDTVQVLAAVNLRIERLRLSALDEQQQSLVGDIDEAVKLASRRLRMLLFDLRPPALDDERGLETALEEALKRLHSDTGIEYTFVSKLEKGTGPEAATVLFRIAQEALLNVRKHSQDATRVRTELAPEGGGVKVTIIDNGVGFAPAPNAPGHLGLTAMQERAAGAGGWWRCESRPGQGTRVEFWVPV